MTQNESGKGESLYSFVDQSGQNCQYLCQKYLLPKAGTIRIGSGRGNTICYRRENKVAGAQAYLSLQEGKWRFGSCEGAEKQEQNHKAVERMLHQGECISICELRLLFLEPYLILMQEVQSPARSEPPAQFSQPRLIPGKTIQVDERILTPVYSIQNAGRNAEKLCVPEKPLGENKGEYFHRAPVRWCRPEEGSIEIEAPPQVSTNRGQPLLFTIGPAMTMVLPMLLSSLFTMSRMSRENGIQGTGFSGGFWLNGLIMAGTSAVLGVFWGLMNQRYGRGQKKRETGDRRKAYEAYLLEKRQQLEALYQQTVYMLQNNHPDTVQCSLYDAQNTRLWNRLMRGIEAEDALEERIGIGNLPFQIKITIPTKKFSVNRDTLECEPEKIASQYAMLYQVPVCINFVQHKAIGMITGRERAAALNLVQNLVLQTAANHCYTEVKLVFLYREQDQEADRIAQCIKWLPHAWDETRGLRLIAGTAQEASEVLFYLYQVCKRREKAEEERAKQLPKPYYILIILEKEYLEGEMITHFLYQKNEKYGMSMVWAENSRDRLPNLCQFFIQKDEEFQGIICESQENYGRLEVQFDQVGAEQAEDFGRRICGLRVNEIEENGEIPAYLPFLELFDVKRVDRLQVVERWQKNKTYESMKVPIGKRAGGKLWYLDIHEKSHGPHGLIAGTTGSGKSETLQTYLLSLAIHFGPEDISFFIIDYKGGGMGDLFTNLPHTAGMISNLSGRDIKRALVSIKSENRRRQRLFHEYGVNHIDGYSMLYRQKEAELPIPHLFLVVDEFAELKREEPEFMRELISVAQVGRSLGIHLILATQKPAGTVDDNIWSNARFKLCLRVQDRQDSMDMLHKPDAAGLTGAGRCYMQVGNDELYELFQAGYSGCPYEEMGETDGTTGNARMIGRTGRPVLPEARNGRTEQKNQKPTKKVTQLEAVIAGLSQIAEKTGIGKARQLWLPPMPVRLYLTDLERASEESSLPGTGIPVVLGLVDDPANQSQYPLEIDVTQPGHLLVCGGPASGKSCLLQTLLFAVCRHYTAGQVVLYLLDYSSKLLQAFGQMPHTGGVFCQGETDRISRLFYFLQQKLTTRKELLAGGNFEQYNRNHSEADQLPVILVVIDNYGGFRTDTGERYEQLLSGLAREGQNNGIYLILTGNSMQSGQIPMKLADNMKNRLVLELGDRFQYGEILKQTGIEFVLQENCKGRGLLQVENRILEFQTALALEIENDFGRMEEIQRIAERERSQAEYLAERIPEIPEHPTWMQLLRQERQNPDCLPIGYQVESGLVYELNLQKAYCYLITGKKGTGKEMVLGHLAKELQQLTYRVVWIKFTPEGQQSTSWIDQMQKEMVSTDQIQTEQQLYEWCRNMVSVFQSNEQTEKVAVMITDLNEFCRRIYHPEQEDRNFSGFFENILEKGAGKGVNWFACHRKEDNLWTRGTTVYELFLGYGYGLHLGGNLLEQSVFSMTQMSYAEQTRLHPAGIGICTENQSGKGIQIRLPEGE